MDRKNTGPAFLQRKALNECKLSNLRWLETVSSTYSLMGRYNHSLFLEATIMVSKYGPTIVFKHVVTIFATQ